MTLKTKKYFLFVLTVLYIIMVFFGPIIVGKHPTEENVSLGFNTFIEDNLIPNFGILYYGTMIVAFLGYIIYILNNGLGKIYYVIECVLLLFAPTIILALYNYFASLGQTDEYTLNLSITFAAYLLYPFVTLYIKLSKNSEEI